MNSVKRLQILAGVEGTIDVDRVVANVVQTDTLRHGRWVCEEHHAVLIRPEPLKLTLTSPNVGLCVLVRRNASIVQSGSKRAELSFQSQQIVWEVGPDQSLATSDVIVSHDRTRLSNFSWYLM